MASSSASAPPIPFCLPMIGQEEIEEVTECLRSGWITTGPRVQRFEAQVREYIGCQHAVALASCTAALHIALLSRGISPSDEVITSPMTFAATVNTILHCGARPVLSDIDPKTGNLDPARLAEKITKRTKAIVPVHFAGLPCEMAAIRDLANAHGLTVIEDAAHAIGAEYRGNKIGQDGDACFSFYPIKNMTTGEGGLYATNDAEAARRARIYSLHGMSRDAWKRYTSEGSWYYEITYPGFKYNMTDIQAAIGIPQLRRLPTFLAKREALVARYREGLVDLSGSLTLPAAAVEEGTRHAYHLFTIQVQKGQKVGRDRLIELLKERGIGTSVNFIPICHHPYYREHLGISPEDFPSATSFYEGVLSLPLYPSLAPENVDRICEALHEIFAA